MGKSQLNWAEIDVSQKGKFDLSVHNMRGIAILPIVILHSYDSFYWQQGAIEVLILPVFRHVNILLMFISGFLHAYLSAKFHYKTYLIRKTTNVLIPYLIWSVPSITMYVMGLKEHQYLTFDPTAPNPILVAGYFLATGAHLAPYWFIPMLTIYFVISPVTLWLSRQDWFVPFIIISFCVAVAVGRPENSNGPFQSALFFAPVYFMGMWFSTNYNSVKAFAHNHAKWAIASTAGSILLSIAMPLFTEHTPHLFLKMVLTASVFVLVQAYLDKPLRGIGLVASTSFGIYFLHAYIFAFERIVMDRLGLTIQGNIFLVLIWSAAATAISIAGVLLVRRFVGPKRSRMLIGA